MIIFNENDFSVTTIANSTDCLNPINLYKDTTTGVVYVSCVHSGVISINQSIITTIATLTDCNAPEGIFMDSISGIVYVSCIDNIISIFDSVVTTIATITQCQDSLSVYRDPINGFVYATCASSNQVIAIAVDDCVVPSNSPTPYCFVDYKTLNSSFLYLSNVSILASSSIINSTSSVVIGDIDLYPGTNSSVINFKNVHMNDTLAQETMSFYKYLLNRFSSSNIGVGTILTRDLGGKKLIPGIYSYTGSATLTGTLTLSGLGQYIFQIGTTLTTAVNSEILLTDGARSCDIFWKVGISATLNGPTLFNGDLAVQDSIHLIGAPGTIVNGRLLTLTGSVSIISPALINGLNATCFSQPYCPNANISNPLWPNNSSEITSFTGVNRAYSNKEDIFSLVFTSFILFSSLTFYYYHYFYI